MTRPADIPQDVQNEGAKWAGEYYAWLCAGNSTGNLSEHAVAAMADSFACAIMAATEAAYERCAGIAEGQPYLEYYRTWPWWKMEDGCGNRSNESELVTHSDQIAAAIRKATP